MKQLHVCFEAAWRCLTAPAPSRMAQRPAPVARAVLVAATLLMLNVSPALAQRPRPVIKRPTVKGRLSPNQIRENRRPPIPFKPFDMVDPETGKPVAGNTVITLPNNGKKVTAQQYYTQLNQIELWLTQRGYSLRQHTPSTNRIPGARGTVVVELVSNEGLMQQQLRRRPTGRTSNPARFQSFLPQAMGRNQALQIDAARLQARRPQLPLDPRRIEAINASASRGTVMADGVPLHPAAANMIAHAAGLGLLGSNITRAAQQGVLNTNLPPPPCTPVNDPQSWSADYGDPNTFHAYLNTQLTLQGQACLPPDINHADKNNSQFTLTAAATGGGTIFGIGGDILTLTGTANVSGASSTAGVGFDVAVFGQNAYHYPLQPQTAEWEAKDNVSQGLDFSTDITVPVAGPLTIDVTIGASGNAGLSYDLYLSPMYAQGVIQPFVNANVYAQAGGGVKDVVEVGVGVNLTLVQWNLNLGAKAGLYISTDPRNYLEFALKDDLYANTNVTLLAGDLYGFAKVGHPCAAWPPWCVSEYDVTIWSEPGLTSGPLPFDLFDRTNEVQLKWASATPMELQGSGVSGGLN